MGVMLFVAAFVALFVQVATILLTLYLVLHGITDLPMAAGAGIVVLLGLASLVAYGHLVFIALLHRRLKREGRRLRIPHAVARALARLLDGIGYAL